MRLAGFIFMKIVRLNREKTSRFLLLMDETLLVSLR